MRFGVKTLLIVFTLAAVVMGVHWWWEYYQTRNLIPVVIHTAPMSTHSLPTEVRVSFDGQSLEQLRFDHRAWKNDKSRKRKNPRIHLQNIIDRPRSYSHYSIDSFQKAEIDIDQLGNRIAARLDEPRVPSEYKIEYAIILVRLIDRRGLDWMLRHLLSHRQRTLSGREFVVLRDSPERWLADFDVWSLIEPKSKDDPVDYRHAVAKRHCPQALYDFYLAGLRDENTDPEWRIEMARWFHYANPTYEALQASDFLFQPTSGRPEPYFPFLEKYLEVGEPEITELALQYASNLVLENNLVSKSYFDLIGKFSDHSWLPFFQRHLNTPHLKSRSFVAIANRSPDPIQFLRDGLTHDDPELRTTALKELLAHLKASNDRPLAEYLHEQFEQATQCHEKQKYVHDLFCIGDSQALEYFDQVCQQFPDTCVKPGRIDDLITLLQRYGLGKDLDKGEIIEHMMIDRRLPQPFSADRVFREIIVRAGLYHNVYLIDKVMNQLPEFAKMSRGDLKIKNCTPYFKEGAVSFELDNVAYEFDVAEPDVYYDPHLIGDVLNAILARRRIRNRIIAHDVHGKEAYFFYGPPALALRLREDFGIKFMKGSQAYIDEGS